MTYILLFGHAGQTFLNTFNNDKHEHDNQVLLKSIQGPTDMFLPSGESIPHEAIRLMVADLDERYPEDINLFIDTYTSIIQKFEGKTDKYGPELIMTLPSDQRMDEEIPTCVHGMLEKIQTRGKLVSFIGINRDEYENGCAELALEILNYNSMIKTSGAVRIRWDDFISLANHRYGNLHLATEGDIFSSALTVLKSVDWRNAYHVLLNMITQDSVKLSELSDAAKVIDERLNVDHPEAPLIWNHYNGECTRTSLLVFRDM